MCQGIVEECAGVQPGKGEGIPDRVQSGPGSEVIVALDAVSLYPSIQKNVAVDLCRQAALETDIEIKI